MKLIGKTALVTGASRGIGREIALELARQGVDVVVNYAGSEAKAHEVVEEIKGLGREAIAIQCDVSNSESVTDMVKETVDHFGKIDILVNNAGITRDNLLMRMKENEWDDVMNINLKGVFLCTKAVTRQMMKQRNGRIINISSVVGLIGKELFPLSHVVQSMRRTQQTSLYLDRLGPFFVGRAVWQSAQ